MPTLRAITVITFQSADGKITHQLEADRVQIDGPEVFLASESDDEFDDDPVATLTGIDGWELADLNGEFSRMRLPIIHLTSEIVEVDE